MPEDKISGFQWVDGEWRRADSLSVEQPIAIDGDMAELLRQLAVEVNDVLQKYRPALQKVLDGLEGKTFESLAEKKRIAAIIQGVANMLQTAFVCPKCGEPARLKCVQTGNAKNGVFSFAHTKGTHGATAAVPKLSLMEKGCGRDFVLLLPE